MNVGNGITPAGNADQRTGLETGHGVGHGTGSGDPYDSDKSSSPRVRGLNRRQEMAIVALLNEPTVRRASELSNIPEATMRRWLTQDAFKRAYCDECGRVPSSGIMLTRG